ncbi:FAD-binding protein [Chryseobacterium potabilaquae]|uniref:3-hydroxybenzoate 4-monooxygenase n=1 Tax=Chryseobacterium potabilaquae TaxID=2675057 RepID=A0A6N4X377_9FLAO|nr:FAD-binding protein [Chryseobacterium potabilaquae]CAA7193655.1 3-hydroxybenzoate 4-monooxygenase [Chryseobacterium potabilaquae]
MSTQRVDVIIIGAGPVGLMCAYLGQICGLRTMIIDKSPGPLEVGRADALNARTLQLFELVNLFKELYPLGKPCNTSSVWSNGRFTSRQSTWWNELEGCLHKHFLMLGQSYVEKLLSEILEERKAGVNRLTIVENIEFLRDGCVTSLSNGEIIQSSYVIGADGSRSKVRSLFNIPFDIIRPQLIWAVIDGIIDTDFPKVPEIITFQTDTSDVAWIPREGEIDRFYVRMDKKDFSMEEVIGKINHAIKPHTLKFKEVVWFSQFSVKESVAEKFHVNKKVFLAGDACHIHSVNGGQGLNTGLADAFNLMWKLNMVINFNAPTELLQTYEDERRPIAQSVIKASGDLVRSTKYSNKGTHAEDYVKTVQKYAGSITGMGIRYGDQGISGSRIFDFKMYKGSIETRLYSILNYSHFTLLIFGDIELSLDIPEFVKIIQIYSQKQSTHFWADNTPYEDKAILVRPDSYIESCTSLENVESILFDYLARIYAI